jgi:hypothetical protein
MKGIQCMLWNIVNASIVIFKLTERWVQMFENYDLAKC